MLGSRGFRFIRQRHFRQIGDDDVRAFPPEPLRLAAPIHADDAAETAGASRLHAGDGILNDNRPVGLNAETLGGLEEHVRLRFAFELKPGGLDAVHLGVEQILQPGPACSTAEQFLLAEMIAIRMPLARKSRMSRTVES